MAAHMSRRSPRLRPQELIRALERAGWIRVRQRGSHVHLKHPEYGGRVTVPVHTGRILKPATLGHNP
jgi:predicted RNA binding protein YcfA (HicA-like mRNA interferase family)